MKCGVPTGTPFSLVRTLACFRYSVFPFILHTSSLLFYGNRVDAALAGLHQHLVIHASWRGCNSAPVGADTRRERSVLDLEEVHLSLEVADDDMIAEDQRRTQAASGEAVLLPRAGAGIFVERHHCTRVFR